MAKYLGTETWKKLEGIQLSPQRVNITQSGRTAQDDDGS